MNDALTAWLMMPEVPDADVTLEEFLARPASQARALRRGSGAAQWVKGSERAPYIEQKAVCAQCPVREPCLDLALADPNIMGCWGGTTDAERRALRRGAA